MKCPKCGSDIHTQFTQEYSVSEGNATLVKSKTAIIAVPPELTTAEKLLWLVENNLERYPLIDEQGNACVGGVLFIHLATDEYGKDRCIEYTDILQLHEAIVTLYEWAKENENVSN